MKKTSLFLLGVSMLCLGCVSPTAKEDSPEQQPFFTEEVKEQVVALFQAEYLEGEKPVCTPENIREELFAGAPRTCLDPWSGVRSAGDGVLAPAVQVRPDHETGRLWVTISHLAGNDTARELCRKTRQHRKREVVLDLTQNRGGMVQEAVEVFTVFAGRKRPFATLHDRNGKTEALKLPRPPCRRPLPRYVLVGENTFSAAELLAGALRIEGSLLVGERTGGKGVMQMTTWVKFSNTHWFAVSRTVASIALSDGSSYHGVGLAPQVITPDPHAWVLGAAGVCRYTCQQTPNQ